MSPIEKLVLTSDLEPLLERLGDFHVPADRSSVSAPIEYIKRKFDKKADYKDLVIVQRALLITGNTREEVAMTVRKETEIQSGQAVPRITSGPTILFSHSPDEDPQAILDANFEHDGIDVSGQDSLELVAVNDVKGGYVFLVRVCRVHLHKILSGKDPDKEFQISGRRMALVALINSGKNMEKNLLNSATNINNQLESL